MAMSRGDRWIRNSEHHKQKSLKQCFVKLILLCERIMTTNGVEKIVEYN